MKIVKGLLKYIFVFVILILVYWLSLFVTSLIPSSAIKENVTKSSESIVVLGEVGEKKFYDLGYKTEGTFIFTDALMVNTAYSIDSSNPIESMLLARRSYIPGQTTTVYKESKDVVSAPMYRYSGGSFQTKELYGLMHNDGNTVGFEYPRYWHGYLVFLRPLLVLFDYDAISMITCVSFAILAIALSIILGKKVNWITGFIFLASFILMNLYIVATCLNEITTYYVAVVASIIIALAYQKLKKHMGIVFFIVGSFTSFVDLFTTPLITLGIPLLVYFLLKQKNEETSGKKQVLELIKLSVLWGIGYGLTWFAKWAIVDIIYQRGIIKDAIEQILFRTVSTNNDPLLTDTQLQKQYIAYYLGDYLDKALLAIIVVFIVIAIIKNRKKKIKINVVNIIPFIIIMLYPIIWYFAVKQHTLKHFFFAGRIILLSIISFLVIIATLLGYYAKERKSKEEEVKKIEVGKEE